MTRLALCAALLLLGAAADAASFRVRAREQFDTGRFNAGTGRFDAQGFSSAFNIWLEESFRHSYGLAVHRGRLSRAGSDDSFAATSVGLEAKAFPLALGAAPDGKPAEGLAGLWFARLGFLSTALDPAGPAKAGWAHGLTAGTGLEFPVWRLGLAPEIGGRLQFGASDRRALSFFAALGVHFYVFPKD